MAVVELRSRAMASELLVVVVCADAAEGDRAAADAGRLVAHLETRWTRFRPDSDISRINAVGAAGGGVVAVDPSTLVLLDAMTQGYVRTAGRFDPSQLRALLDAGYVASIDDPQARCEPGTVAADPVVGSAIFDLALDTDDSAVTVPAGLALDAGGVGKGLAADLAVAQLIDTGVTGALVAIGGDLACGGIGPSGDEWLVDVEHPDESGSISGRLAVSGGGVATSSVRSRRWRSEGVERHHQIDPTTGDCSRTDLDAVTVVAPSGWLAEVHATAALAVGADAMASYLEGHGLSGVAHAADGRVLVTSDLTSFLALRESAVR